MHHIKSAVQIATGSPTYLISHWTFFSCNTTTALTESLPTEISFNLSNKGHQKHNKRKNLQHSCCIALQKIVQVYLIKWPLSVYLVQFEVSFYLCSNILDILTMHPEDAI